METPSSTLINSMQVTSHMVGHGPRVSQLNFCADPLPYLAQVSEFCRIQDFHEDVLKNAHRMSMKFGTLVFVVFGYRQLHFEPDPHRSPHTRSGC